MIQMIAATGNVHSRITSPSVRLGARTRGLATACIVSADVGHRYSFAAHGGTSC